MAATPSSRPVLLSGPPGVGKGTLINLLRQRHPNTFGFTISHTTRRPRPGEEEGVNYYYISRDRFTSLIKDGAFVEYATFGGELYGTSKQTIQDQEDKGLTALLDIEMEGVKQMTLARGDRARYVFVKPPSFEQLEARLRGRGTESEEQVQERLAKAREEIEYADTPGIYDIVIVNDDLERAYAELDEFIKRTSRSNSS